MKRYLIALVTLVYISAFIILLGLILKALTLLFILGWNIL